MTVVARLEPAPDPTVPGSVPKSNPHPRPLQRSASQRERGRRCRRQPPPVPSGRCKLGGRRPAYARARDGAAADGSSRLVHELLILLGLYGLYSLSRNLIRGSTSVATSHAISVLHAEQALGIDIEGPLTQWLHHSTVLSVVAAYAYATLHYTVTPAVLIAVYRKRPQQYASARRVLVLATVVALVCYWLYPVAPPRLLSPDYPDVLALTSHWGWWGAQASAPRGLGALTNQYAALPSMHVGWATWCAWVTWRSTGNRTIRGIAAGYPVLVTLVVLSTSNHYVLDVLAGALVVGATAVLAGGRERQPHLRARPAPFRRVRSAHD